MNDMRREEDKYMGSTQKIFPTEKVELIKKDVSFFENIEALIQNGREGCVEF